MSQYMGAGELGQLAALLDDTDRAENEATRAALRAERQAELSLDRQIDQAISTTRNLAAAVLLASGYHTHKGQWRRQRGG